MSQGAARPCSGGLNHHAVRAATLDAKQFETQALDLLDAVSLAIYGAPIIRSWIAQQIA
jgi:hypothetical protein